MKWCFTLFVLATCMAAHAQDSTFKEMVGTYKFPAGSVIEQAIVTVENSMLSMRSAQGVSVLERIKGDTFNVISFNGICVFKRDEARKINGVHVDASGYIMEGTKEMAELNGFSDAAEAEKLMKTKAMIQQSVEYNRRGMRKPFLALVYN